MNKYEAYKANKKHNRPHVYDPAGAYWTKVLPGESRGEAVLRLERYLGAPHIPISCDPWRRCGEVRVGPYDDRGYTRYSGAYAELETWDNQPLREVIYE